MLRERVVNKIDLLETIHCVVRVLSIGAVIRCIDGNEAIPDIPVISGCR